MGKIMYKGQEYGGSGGGGEMPSCYDGLTELLENDELTADTTNNVLRGNFEGELKLGYIQDAYKIDENGDPVVWGDTEQTGLTGAIGSMCDRIATLEEGGGGMPDVYDDLTSLLTNNNIEFSYDTSSMILGQHTRLVLADGADLEMTGYTTIDVSDGHIARSAGWGEDSETTDLDTAIGHIQESISFLDENLTGYMTDLQSDVGSLWDEINSLSQRVSALEGN